MLVLNIRACSLAKGGATRALCLGICFCLAALCGHGALAGTRLKGGAGGANATVPAVHLYRQALLHFYRQALFPNATAPDTNRTTLNQTLSRHNDGTRLDLKPSSQRLSNVTNMSRGDSGSSFHRSKHFKSASRSRHEGGQKVSGSDAYQSSFKPSGRRLQSLPQQESDQVSHDTSQAVSDSPRTLNPRQRRTRASHQQEREDRQYIAPPVSESEFLPVQQLSSKQQPVPSVSVHSRPARSTQGAQPIIYVGNNNISLIGSDPKAHIHQVEPLNFSQPHVQQQPPFYNDGTPYEGVFRSNGHPITGLNITRAGPAGLFGYVNNSDIDVVADTPHYRGSTAGLVARAESNNKISLTIRDGQAGCSSTNGSEPCVVGLGVGAVTGDNNRIELRNSSGTVDVSTRGNASIPATLPGRSASARGSEGTGALGIGEMTGSHNRFIQRDTRGTVHVASAGTGVGAPATVDNGRGGHGRGSQATGALGIGHFSGVNNTIDQEQVTGSLKVEADGDGVGGSVEVGGGTFYSVGVGSGRGSTAYAGGAVGRSDANDSTVQQEDVDVNITARTRGDGEVRSTAGQNVVITVFGGDGRASAAYAGAAIGENTGANNSILQSGVTSAVDAQAWGDGKGGNASYVGGDGVGPEVTAGYGIGNDKGVNTSVRQVSVDGSLSLSAEGVGIGGRTNVFQYSGDSIASRTLAGQAIGALQGDNARLLLLAGGNESYPGVNPDGGSCNPEGIIDVAAYHADGVGCGIRQLNSTHPKEWRATYNQSCPGGDRNNSCHAPYEQFQCLVPQGQQALLMTRQRYDDSQHDSQGVFRISRLNKRNGTFPGVDQGFGNDSYLLYAAQENTSVVAAGQQPVSQLVTSNGSHLLSLYSVAGGGAQVASFPLNRSGDGVYRTALFANVTGTPLLLGDDGWSFWTQTSSSLFRHRLDNQGIHSTQSYNLLSSSYGSYPLLTAGIDDHWLYIARTLEQNRQVVLERMYLETGTFDDWQATLDNVTVNADIPYTMDFTGGQVILLPRGEIQQPVSHAGDVSLYNQQIQLGPYGGDARWRLARTLAITPDDPVMSVSMVVTPSSSAPADTSSTPMLSASADTSSTPMLSAPTDISSTPVLSAPADTSSTPVLSASADTSSTPVLSASADASSTSVLSASADTSSTPMLSEPASATVPSGLSSAPVTTGLMYTVSQSSVPGHVRSSATSAAQALLPDTRSLPQNPTPSGLPVKGFGTRNTIITLGVVGGVTVVVTLTAAGTVVCYCVKARHKKTQKKALRAADLAEQAADDTGISMTRLSINNDARK